jgi:hypothetical protein
LRAPRLKRRVGEVIPVMAREIPSSGYALLAMTESSICMKDAHHESCLMDKIRIT